MTIGTPVYCKQGRNEIQEEKLPLSGKQDLILPRNIIFLGRLGLDIITMIDRAIFDKGSVSSLMGRTFLCFSQKIYSRFQFQFSMNIALLVNSTNLFTFLSLIVPEQVRTTLPYLVVDSS